MTDPAPDPRWTIEPFDFERDTAPKGDEHDCDGADDEAADDGE